MYLVRTDLITTHITRFVIFTVVVCVLVLVYLFYVMSVQEVVVCISKQIRACWKDYCDLKRRLLGNVGHYVPGKIHFKIENVYLRNNMIG